MTEDSASPPESHWEAQDNKDLAEQAKVTKQHLAKIRKVAADIDHELPIAERVYTLKQQLNAISIPFTNDVIYHALGVGASTYDEPVDPDQPFILEEERWLLEGVCKFGEFNLVCAEEKLGKTALGVHIAAAALRGDSECLGMPIRHQIDGIIILGPDGNRNEYGKILRREGLLVGTKLDPRVVLWHKGQKMPAFTEKGIQEICKTCLRFKRPLLIPDTLFKCTVPALTNPNVTDKSAEYMIPHQQLEQALQALAPECVVTEWCIAHSKKGQGSGLQGRMRGTNQGTGDASHIIGINWVTPDGDAPRTDFRRSVITDGRDQGDALICEIADDGADGHWISHGNADQMMAQQRQRQKLNGLTGKREELWTWMQWKAIENVEGGTFTTLQCANAAKCSTSSAWAALADWEAEGFIEKAGVIPAGPQGGREQVIYRVAPQWVETELTPIKQETESTYKTDSSSSNTYKYTVDSVNSVLSPSGSIEAIQQDSVNSVAQVDWEGGAPEFLPAKVEIRTNGQPWSNGWVLTGDVASLNPHNLTVERFGNPNLTHPGLRWGQDVRLCQATPVEDEEDFEI